MNLYEYQGKSILRTHGIRVPDGFLILDEEDLEDAIRNVQSNHLVIKAQVLAGGRGKSGGIKVVDSVSDAIQAAKSMLNSNLITPQTDAEGVLVTRVYVESCSDIAHEYYVSFLIDRSTSSICLIASKHGGMDIEEVAMHHPEAIYKCTVNPTSGLLADEILQIADTLELPKQAMADFMETISKLSLLFVSEDMMLLEINPLILTKTFEIVALDAKITLDDHAYYRHPDWNAYFDAEQAGHAYVALDGNIGCLVNGAGLAMATMDAIALEGGKPANFLDVGGSASKVEIEQAFTLLLKNQSVEGVFINIFGGIMQCDTIASAIICAASKLDIGLPIVVRLEGNQKEAGRRIINQAHQQFQIISVDSLDEGAKTIVSIINQANIQEV